MNLSPIRRFASPFRELSKVLRALEHDVFPNRGSLSLTPGPPFSSGPAGSPFPTAPSPLFRDPFSGMLAPFFPALGDAAPAVSVPPVDLDIKETDQAFSIHADLPGMTKEEIKINVSPDHILSIHGERKKEEVKEGAHWRRVERSYGRFERSVKLPEGIVDADRIQAKMEHGVLVLEIPKKPEAERHKAGAKEIRIS